tara:strand:- start:335 stop:1375 length:1041 start_codon:yes stop_codon:yes gene_type:complete
MNEENKTFAEQVVEPTESERIRDRISTFQSQISPQSVQIAQLLLEQHLKAGLVKSAELDALIILRDELNKANIDYRTMMENSQKRLQQLLEEEQVAELEKQTKVKMAEEAKLVDERTLRKNLQDKLAIAEAKLEALSGVQGNVAETPDVEIANPQIKYGEKKPTRAFEMARAINPETKVSDDAMKQAHEELDEFEQKIEATKKSFKEWEEEHGHVAEGTTTESFLEEVEKVENESSAPVISKAQVNETQAENIVADEVDVVEEEFDEVVIPSRTELNRMKKNQINEIAKDLDFSVKMTDTKAVMIDSFLSQVDEYITELQESGEFVSATTDDEDGDTDNIKDGGHF